MVKKKIALIAGTAGGLLAIGAGVTLGLLLKK
jgi:hypothetical protein